MGISLSSGDEYNERGVETKFENEGFTLIELLLAIAVIGILTGILFPVVLAVRTQVLFTKSRVQFNQYVMALEAFKQEYGFYPRLGEQSSVGDVSFSLINPSTQKLFIETLSARPAHSENQSISDEASALNRKSLSFYSFSESDFNDSGEIVDAFENRDIKIFLDADGNGFINAEMLKTNFKDVHDNDYVPDDDDVPDDIRAGVVILSAGERGNFIKSWE